MNELDSIFWWKKARCIAFQCRLYRTSAFS